MYGGVRGRKTKVGEKLLRFPPTRLAKLNKASDQTGDIHARPFLSGVDFYYKRERQYDAEGLTPEERGRRRQDLESKEMLITLSQHLKIELDKDPSETTPYLREALNYLDKF